MGMKNKTPKNRRMKQKNIIFAKQTSRHGKHNRHDKGNGIIDNA